MRGRVRMESKAEIFRFFNSGFSIFRRRAFLRTQNTLI